jgi:hypothetical protein
MRPVERVFALAAHKCRNLSDEISQTIVDIEHQRVAAGRVLADRSRPMDERHNALLELKECDEVITLLKDFKAEALVASGVLLRGSAVAFLTFIEGFESTLEQRQERTLHLALKVSSSFARFIELLGSLNSADQSSDKN